jgi:cytochrome c-type biogenesis protein CcmH
MNKIRSYRWSWIILAALLFSATTAGWAEGVWAQAPTVPQVSPDEVNTVARELWCPLCSGVRLDSCELKACDQMKEMIALKLAEGEEPEQIKAYFVEQYGPQVLGEPPMEGINWLAWIAPFVAVAAGAVFVWVKARQMVRPAAPPATASARGPVAHAAANGSGESTEDDYAAKLDEELANYG